MTPEHLKDYVRNRMRKHMAHIYQPVMLREIIEQGGEASVEDIAKALLSYDQSEIEYYSGRTKEMVGTVLVNNGVVEKVKNGRRVVGFRLLADAMDEQQKSLIIAECDNAVREYIDKHGAAIWEHRTNDSGYVPGSIRYQVLKRASYRCELCGVHEAQAALHVDHIIPRSKGGKDDVANFQALCITCNTNKRDTDDTDFRGIAESYSDRDRDCIFCNLPSDRIVAENELCFAIRDAFPVTDEHTLIIPKRHVSDYFDLYQPERNAIDALMKEQRELLTSNDRSISGFNVGINAGASAGQTVFHVHVHLIPRRDGDVASPRGGVRGVIPERQSY